MSSPVKRTLAFLSERAARLKTNGRLFTYSPLSRVVELETLALGILGKLALWEGLAELLRCRASPASTSPTLRDAPAASMRRSRSAGFRRSSWRSPAEPVRTRPAAASISAPTSSARLEIHSQVSMMITADSDPQDLLYEPNRLA